MTRRTQNILYHTLPIAYWLLAAVVCLVAYLSPFSDLTPTLSQGKDFLLSLGVAAIIVLAALILQRIPHHTDSVLQSFHGALLLGIASCWLPSVLLLLLPAWGYLIYRNLFSLRSFCATLLGLATVAIWASILHSQFSILNSQFSILNFNLYAWIPVGSFLTAYIASVLTRQALRVR